MKTKAQVEAEYIERLNTDFAFFAEKYCKIKDTQGRFIPFVLNDVQRRLTKALDKQWKERGQIRMVILKARQQGFSTFFQAYTYWQARQRSTTNAYVVANDLATSKTLFKTLQDTHRAMPPRLQPKLDKSSVREMLFAESNTSIEVGTPGSDALARGRTIHVLWISELGYWGDVNASDSLGGLLNCVHDVPGTIVVCESTANGVSGPYYDLYKGAPDNKFEKFFSAWFETESYRDENLPEGFGEKGGPFELTIDEIELLDANPGKIDLAQLWWRRQKLAAVGRDSFYKDYPGCEDDAFQNSGSPVFPPQALQAQLNSVDEVIAQREYDEAEDTFFDFERGPLTVWHEPKAGVEYYIGVDVSHGTVKGDWSVAQVFDENRVQVAIYRGKITAGDFGAVLNRLGHLYNEAKIIVEANSIGHTTLHTLSKTHFYYNLWRRPRTEKMYAENTETLGFVTNAQTKPMIIWRLAEDLRCNSLKINCPVTLGEMREFIKLVPKGGDDDKAKLQAPRGKFDDAVIATALVNYINDGIWTPIPQDVIEDLFLDAY